MKLNPTALIIDGELAVRRLVRILLEEERYKVIGADTGRKGLESAVAERPDVIILELDLPYFDLSSAGDLLYSQGCSANKSSHFVQYLGGGQCRLWPRRVAHFDQLGQGRAGRGGDLGLRQPQ